MKTKIVHIYRKKQDQETLGFFTVMEHNIPLHADVCLELPWKDNKPDISCIPTGIYDLKLEWSAHFKQKLWEIKGVPGRSECKFHIANYLRQLRGCVAPGTSVKDIDGDGKLDVTSSGDALQRFHAAMGSDTEATLIVHNSFSKDLPNPLDDDCC